MPGEYSESTVSGNAYIRARKVIIDYALDQIPVATFIRERVMTLGGETIKTSVVNVSSTYNPTAEIALRDPDTGELTNETMTHAQMFKALYSLFYQLSMEADA